MYNYILIDSYALLSDLCCPVFSLSGVTNKFPENISSFRLL